MHVLTTQNKVGSYLVCRLLSCCDKLHQAVANQDAAICSPGFIFAVRLRGVHFGACKLFLYFTSGEAAQLDQRQCYMAP